MADGSSERLQLSDVVSSRGSEPLGFHTGPAARSLFTLSVLRFDWSMPLNHWRPQSIALCFVKSEQIAAAILRGIAPCVNFLEERGD
ncbi:hypothetical protein RRG08_040824 [Elysia crispata]|uniref:Uncharacterized protein n=1 Tax=Elysia crispata TaxID=231223 RepID=A0AAE0Z959_9GAST|nr:hypothetical protein RRG08_040824 [Elysia crispata]